MPLDLEQAQNLRAGDILYHMYVKDSRKNPSKARVTSIKTWKQSPHRVLVRWKHGLYTHGEITELGLSQWTLDESEARQSDYE